MKDSYFDMVLRDLPVDSTDILIEVRTTYASGGQTLENRSTMSFPSKAEASYRRELVKTEDSMKTLAKSIDSLGKSFEKFEAEAIKRFRKLEKDGTE